MGKLQLIVLIIKTDLGSISGRVMPKTLKMILDTYLLNIQQYKVRIKGKEGIKYYF